MVKNVLWDYLARNRIKIFVSNLISFDSGIKDSSLLLSTMKNRQPVAKVCFHHNVYFRTACYLPVHLSPVIFFPCWRRNDMWRSIFSVTQTQTMPLQSSAGWGSRTESPNPKLQNTPDSHPSSLMCLLTLHVSHIKTEHWSSCWNTAHSFLHEQNKLSFHADESPDSPPPSHKPAKRNTRPIKVRPNCFLVF